MARLSLLLVRCAPSREINDASHEEESELC